MANKGTFKKVWAMPIWLGVITLAGLILAIIGTGIWHWMAWLALAWPIYIMTKFGAKAFK